MHILGGASTCGCFYPHVRTRRAQPGRGVFAGGCFGVLGATACPGPGPCSPHQQLLFPHGCLKASGPMQLDGGDVMVPWAWDDVALQWGDLHAEDGQGPLCSSPRAHKPTQRCCSCLEEKSGHPGVNPPTLG